VRIREFFLPSKHIALISYNIPMIEIEVVSSSDLDVIGPKKYFRNHLVIGKDLGDLLVNDSEIINYHFMLKVVKSKLVAQLNNTLSYFHINGKKSSGTQYLLAGDVIKLGETQIEIKNFEKSQTPSKIEKLEKSIDEIFNTDTLPMNILKLIEEEYKEL